MDLPFRSQAVRCTMILYMFLLVLVGVYGSAQDCPAEITNDNGIFANGYQITETDTTFGGGTITNGSITHNNPVFDHPEVSGTQLVSSLEVTVVCATVAAAGCDGNAVTNHLGNADTVSSHCIGCSGTVSVTITGEGEYNATHYSTTNRCTCNSTGHSFFDGYHSFGQWNATGNCTFESGLDSGECACSPYDGAVITPLGPWRTYGNCSECSCDKNGTIYTPPTRYNVSGPNNDYYISGKKPTDYFPYRTTGDNAYYPHGLSTTNYYPTRAQPDTFFFPTGLSTTAYFPITYVSGAKFFPTGLKGSSAYFPQTAASANAFFPTGLKGSGAYFPQTTASPGAFFPTGLKGSGSYFPTGKSTTALYPYRDPNQVAYFPVKGNSSNHYPTQISSANYYPNSLTSSNSYYTNMLNSSNYYPSYNASKPGCTISNCTCGSDGSVTSASDCGCACVLCSLNATCSCDGSTASTTPSEAANYCGCQCPSCASTTCSCDSSGSASNSAGVNASAECGCTCTACNATSATCNDAGSVILSDSDAGVCGWTCLGCSSNATCTCDSSGTATTSPSEATDLCGCSCGNCSTANATCDSLGNVTAVTPSEAHGYCGFTCESCDTTATCSCSGSTSVTSPVEASDYCGCTCPSCASENVNCSCTDGLNASVTSPADATNYCGCQCDSCNTTSASCDGSGAVTVSPSDATGYCSWSCPTCTVDNVNCSCAGDANSSVTTPSEATDHCGCRCDSCNITSATCSNSGAVTTSPSDAHDYCEWQCPTCLSSATCSCAGDANSSVTTPSEGTDHCGCYCDSCANTNATCASDGNTTTIPSDATNYCGWTCPACATTANCSCDSSGVSTTTPLDATDFCGCNCTACRHTQASCNSTGYTFTSPSVAHDHCGWVCPSCDTNATCSCDSSGVSTTTPSEATDYCGCNCSSCATEATCGCGSPEPQYFGNSSTYPTAVRADQASAEARCGCSCVAWICECDCRRDSCACECPQTESCNCTRNTCGSTTSEDGKKFNATGGNTCSVQAGCYQSDGSSHGGFYAGGLFTVYNQAITAHLSKTTAGTESELTASTYLSSVSAGLSSGVADFSSLYVQKVVARASNYLTMWFTTHTNAFSTNYTSTFQAIPQMFRVYNSGTSNQYTSSNSYAAGAGKTNIGNYTVKLYDSQTQEIDVIDPSDGFNASVILTTGANLDSSTVSNYPSSYSQVDMADLIVTDRPTDTVSEGDTLSIQSGNIYMEMNLNVQNQMGGSYQIVVDVQDINTGTKYVILEGSSGNPIRIDPSAITVSLVNGTTSDLFAQGFFPKIVKVDGSPQVVDTDGLPGIMRLDFNDAAGNLLTNAQCVDCVQVRLMKCTDALSAATSYPACSSVLQATCATDSASGGACSSSSSYLETLSGTTTADVKNGTATFTNLQLAHVVGAGYRLQFYLNAGNLKTTTSQTISSPHTTGVGEVSLPDPSYSTAGVNNSFFVRPYSITVLQSPGGDGVDINNDNAPDGVGADLPFRVQPAICLNGNGYEFDQDWGTHGFVPVSAIIKSGACNGDCSNHSLVLSSSTNKTGVATHASTFTAATNQDAKSVTSLFSGTQTSTVVQGLYDSFISKVGFLWRDLKITTTDTETAQDNVFLEFRVGPYVENSMSTSDHTSVTSDEFDVFITPDQATNLRIFSYEEQGFRFEFDPPAITRTRPLSGFILEVDECYKEEPDSCYTFENDNFDPAYNVKTILGSDLSTGGGHTEEVFVEYENVTKGSVASLYLEVEPKKTLEAGDALVLFLGGGEALLASFTACSLTGEDGWRFTPSADASVSKLTLTVKTDVVVSAHKPIKVTVPQGCNIIPPGGDNAESRKKYGGQTPALPLLIIAPVVGAGTRFDNCKVNSTATVNSSSTGCRVKSTRVMPLFVDGSSMDLAWSGTLYYNAIGSACSDKVRNNSGIFPASKFCAQEETNSNDPDAYDSLSTGNSGHNGKPIGQNPGRSGTSGEQTTGSPFGDTSAACRDGTATQNPCALEIGTDWTLGVNISLYKDGELTVGEVQRLDLQFKRDRVYAVGDEVQIPISGLTFSAVTTGNGTACSVYTEKSNTTGTDSSSSSANATNSSASSSSNTSACAALMTTVYINHTQLVTGWTSQWVVSTNTLIVTVGNNVQKDSTVYVRVDGFNGSCTTQFADEAIAVVKRASRTTFIFRNGAKSASYQSNVTGDPVANYRQSDTLSLTEGGIYNFRVYGYNGRFQSAKAETVVQNRDINPPANPAYFTTISQDAIGVKLTYTNIQGTQTGTTSDTTANPTAAVQGEATRIGISFKPDAPIVGGQTVSIALPGFTGPDYLIFNQSGPYYIYKDEYLSSGTSSSCSCSAGTIFTPRNVYSVIQNASGTGSCSYTADPNCTATNTTSCDRPWCACNDCSCSLAGVPTTPATIYNVSGNHSDCSCASDGTPVTPATTYTASGNCSSCACSASGATSHDSYTAGGGSCTNCSCTGAGNSTASVAGTDCSSCPCQYQACSCACQPIKYSCSCSAFRECSCGCSLTAQYSCSCEQNVTSPIITRAIWSGYTSTLVLEIDTNSIIPGGEETTIWVPKSAGIKYPSDGAIPLGPNGNSGTLGNISSFKLTWVTPLPSATQPREGFLVQYSTDRLFKTDVRSVVFPDVLDRGIIQRTAITHLAKDVGVSDTKIQLAIPAQFANGRIIEIDNELMGVYAVDAADNNTIYVTRGVLSTSAAAHTVVSGGDSCSCNANSTALGGPSCVCTSVKLVYQGATDISVYSGLDQKLGYLGSACRIGTQYENEGCNPLGYSYATGARTFQTATIFSGLPEARWAGACSSTDPNTCSTDCQCSKTSKLTGRENGNIIFGNNLTIASPGDPLAFPVTQFTTLSLATDGVSTSITLAVASTANLLGNYIRIDDEIMLVTGVTRGVLGVRTFNPYGGASCSCTVDGTSSGGSTCGCTGSAGTGCTAGGTITALTGGGTGFEATFTVNATTGSLTEITVTQPGSRFSSIPSLTISSGGTGCTGLVFTPVMSSSILVVERAKFGTTVGGHATGASVNYIPWPSQSDPIKPGLRYNFRIAAYNRAGLSDFIYFTTKVFDVFPREIPAEGGVPIEVIMVGGGSYSTNVTIWIGHLGMDGLVEENRSKACGALENLDAAGTRLVCRAPAWVGQRHDLIVEQVSGIFRQLAVGSGWMKYSAPVITSVRPASVDAGVKVDITVSGRNFGTNTSDVSGQLSGSDKIPCKPIKVIGDTQVICTLEPKQGQSMNGDIFLTVGTAWSGGGQTTNSGPQTTIKEKPPPVQAEATVPLNIADIPAGSAARTAVETSFTNDCAKALGIPASRIQVLDIKAGSVIIVFVILPDANSATATTPAALAVELAAQAADPNSVLRQGAITSQVTVALPAGTAEQAARDVAAATVTTSSTVPLWESSCIPKSYTAFDMEICYDCCIRVCEWGEQVPQVDGADVWSGDRHAVCQSLCLVHCGYTRPFNPYGTV